MKGVFSERVGYLKPSDVVIIGRLLPELVTVFVHVMTNWKTSRMRVETLLFATEMWNLISGYSSCTGGKMISWTVSVMLRSLPQRIFGKIMWRGIANWA